MSMIKVEHLTFSYSTSHDLIFDDVSFQIDTDWKLGFVGRNGRGKTTFLNILLGKYEYEGKISAAAPMEYFPYQVTNQDRWTLEVLQEICTDAQEWELIRELSYLEVEAEVLWRPFNTLSNGEQTKVLLAALFLKDGRVLLIDEPTNHLDTMARQRVAAYLKRKKGFILVSHDRYFLDGCVDHILSLNRADIQVQSGNFSCWMENFQRQQDFEMAKNQKLKKDIGRLQQAARRTATWSDRVEASKRGAYDKGYVGHKSAKMMKRAMAIQERQKQAIEEKSALLKNAERADVLKISPLVYRSDTLVTFDEVMISYSGKSICPPVSFTIRSGERVGLDGKNGSGKTSLLKLLVGENMDHTGVITLGSGLVISYVSQDTSWLQGSLTDFAKKSQIDESLFKTILRKMDFERIQFEKDMKEFSGGQKKKVLIARSLCEKAHLYVWDEPLNFIDMYSRIQIEELLLEYSPTMIFVEHDKAFKERIATKEVLLG